MKRQKSCGPRLGKLVHQLPGVITFAYDLRFRRVIARWKDLSKAYNARDKITSLDATTYPKKHRLGPQNGPRSSGPEKTAKNSKLSKTEKLKEAMVGVQVE
jgi:hypothetical protein